jgi:hypothetical protein
VILQYAVKFVCTEALQPGTYWYGLSAPLVYQKTDVLIHNPWPYPVRLYKKAVEAPVEDFSKVEQGLPPGKWKEASLAADYAFRIDCDDIAKLLTGDPAATFIGKYGIGKTVEGFVVLGIGLQNLPGTAIARYGSLDVTADYVRGSEVLKKDIHYQPWWTWWWWSLPWRLGYPYERIIPLQPTTGNIDCIRILADTLIKDAEGISNGSQREATISALNNGATLLSSRPTQLSNENPAALVPLIGRCTKLDATTVDIDYVLVSNKGPSDGNPLNGTAAEASQVLYPWIPGRWYDLAVVVPQNIDVDMHDYFQNWQLERWVAAGETRQTALNALVYYFPYWCGWGYWWWWWNSGDCVDIGVGEGESIDVEQITPSRILVPQWPPSLN